jgi:hypothetical protein
LEQGKLMSDDTPAAETADDPLSELRARAEALERQLTEVQNLAEARLIMAELKTEAVRAGMIDLDGLKLADLSRVKVNSHGEVDGASEIMLQLKKAKPWLFGVPSSSSIATPPPAQALRQKLATEMTDAEYRAAREALLRGRL